MHVAVSGVQVLLRLGRLELQLVVLHLELKFLGLGRETILRATLLAQVSRRPIFDTFHAHQLLAGSIDEASSWFCCDGLWFAGVGGVAEVETTR